MKRVHALSVMNGIAVSLHGHILTLQGICNSSTDDEVSDLANKALEALTPLVEELNLDLNDMEV